MSDHANPIGLIDRFLCPIDTCTWYHEQPAMQIPDGVTENDLRDLGKLHTSQVEDVLREHYSSHGLEEWLRTVSLLKQQLDTKAVTLCLACVVERHNAQRASHPLPPQNVAQIVANGASLCLEHLQITEGPVLPDRSAGGIVLPGGPLAPRPNGG